MLLVSLLHIILLQMVSFQRTNAIEEPNSTIETPHNELPFQDPRSSESLTSGERVWKSLKKVKEMSRGIPDAKFTLRKRSRSDSQLTEYLHELDAFHVLSDRHGLNQTTAVSRATIAQLHNQAQDGSVDSSYFLGLVYLYGLDFSRSDAVKALQWFKEAAEKGHIEAQCALGLLFYYGIGAIGKDRKKAMRWFYQCSTIGTKFIYCHWLLGRALYEGLTFEDIGVRTKDAISALKIVPGHYEALGDPPSTFILAAHLFLKAENVNQATHHLAIMHEYGLIPIEFPDFDNTTCNRLSRVHPPNFERAAELYRKASRMGSLDSFYNLALMHTYGRGVALNHARAIDLFRQATMWRHAPSMQYLGRFALKGWGQPNDKPNVEDAIFWLSQCIQYTRNEAQKRMCEEDISEVELVVQEAESIHASALKRFK